jgi:Zn-dependent protease
MLFFLLNDPILFVFAILALMLGITVHEFMHAWSANALGDPTAKYYGRLTLNPLKHLDPLGSLLLILVGFGWGKPVPVNPTRLRWGKWGDVLVSLSGAISNLLTATIFALAMRILFVSGVPANLYVLKFLNLVIELNLLLAVFNLLPIPPLDGSKVLFALIPEKFADFRQKYENMGPLILFAILLLERLMNISIFFGIISPIINFIYSILVGYQSHIF